MVWGRSYEPTYIENQVTKEYILTHRNKATEFKELDEFINSIQPDDKLFRFQFNQRNRGTIGYYRLLPDGTKQHVNVIVWMS